MAFRILTIQNKEKKRVVREPQEQTPFGGNTGTRLRRYDGSFTTKTRGCELHATHKKQKQKNRGLSLQVCKTERTPLVGEVIAKFQILRIECATW
jgi:hypothetical protein